MFPRWLSWLMVGICAYLLLQQTHMPHDMQPAPVKAVAEKTPDTETKEIGPSLAAATDAERWKRAINPDYAAKANCTLAATLDAAPQLSWRMTEDAVGAGDAASCTQTIHIKLTVWNAQGRMGHTQTLPVTLGAHAVASGLDAALVGIRIGGIRTVVLAPEALKRDPKAPPIAKLLAAALGNGKAMVVVTVERIAH